jgi:hypothetical protein
VATPADKAGDYNDDDSQVTHPATGEPMTNTQPSPDMDTYFRRLDEELTPIEGEDEFNAAWHDLGVEAALIGNEPALDRAEELRRKHVARIEGIARQELVKAGQGDLLGGERPFPGIVK